MIFWDSSAIVPLLVAEPATAQMQALARQDPDLLVWWASQTECASALSRLEHADALSQEGVEEALRRLMDLAQGWHEIEPCEIVREAAARFLRVHPLRAADALQLAAAFVAAEGRPRSLPLVSLDDRLLEAARKEGFPVAERVRP
jgi:hypothetical protein